MTWLSFFHSDKDASKKEAGRITATSRDMKDVMRDVDKQVGRAVTRLADS
jgi:hypothetical protein